MERSRIKGRGFQFIGGFGSRSMALFLMDAMFCTPATIQDA